jgi:hypothetical protein
MKLEVTTFRPREVIKHVLRTAAPASLKKELTLEGYIGDDVPLEVLIINDILFLVICLQCKVYVLNYSCICKLESVALQKKIKYLFYKI